jgi:hypothetical protein
MMSPWSNHEVETPKKHRWLFHLDNIEQYISDLKVSFTKKRITAKLYACEGVESWLLKHQGEKDIALEFYNAEGSSIKKLLFRGLNVISHKMKLDYSDSSEVKHHLKFNYTSVKEIKD